jgi:glucokinase
VARGVVDGYVLVRGDVMTDILIADIGGSTTRLALADPGGRPDHIIRFENDDIAGIEVAIEQYLAGQAARPRRAVLAAAGPVEGDEIVLTNRDWRFRRDTLARKFGFSRVDVINDFQAVAWSLPKLRPEELQALGTATTPDAGPKVALGPGTGLGVSALVPNGKNWIAVATEGGHISFGPAHEDEIAILRSVGGGSLAVSAEMAVSGRGLERLYHAMNPDLPAQPARGVVAAAQAGDQAAIAVIAMFVRLFGRFAGDIALAYRASGGVYIAGGIARRFGALFDSAVFRRAFEAHPPFETWLVGVPTFLVTYTEPGLLGCAAYAERGE